MNLKTRMAPESVSEWVTQKQEVLEEMIQNVVSGFEKDNNCVVKLDTDGKSVNVAMFLSLDMFSSLRKKFNQSASDVSVMLTTNHK